MNRYHILSQASNQKNISTSSFTYSAKLVSKFGRGVDQMGSCRNVYYFNQELKENFSDRDTLGDNQTFYD